jgi:hypothetical protein
VSTAPGGAWGFDLLLRGAVTGPLGVHHHRLGAAARAHADNLPA